MVQVINCALVQRKVFTVMDNGRYRMLASMVRSFARRLGTLFSYQCTMSGNEGTEFLPFPYKITKCFLLVNPYF